MRRARETAGVLGEFVGKDESVRRDSQVMSRVCMSERVIDEVMC